MRPLPTLFVAALAVAASCAVMLASAAARPYVTAGAFAYGAAAAVAYVTTWRRAFGSPLLVLRPVFRVASSALARLPGRRVPQAPGPRLRPGKHAAGRACLPSDDQEVMHR